MDDKKQKPTEKSVGGSQPPSDTNEDAGWRAQVDLALEEGAGKKSVPVDDTTTANDQP